MIKKILIALIALIIAGGVYLVNFANGFQSEGKITLSILQEPVVVERDERMVPYVFAQSLSDALKAQGYLTAQDRLYQLELFKHLGRGQLSMFIGERGIKVDTLIHNLNIADLAKRQIAVLNPQARKFYLDYIAGINAYITQGQHEFPLSMSLLSHTPDAWTLQDIVALQFFQIWSSSANWKTELLTQQAIDKLGSKQAYEIAMLSVNPDDESIGIRQREQSVNHMPLNLTIEQAWLDAFPDVEAAASNAWATTKSRSKNALPILVNSPHLDATTLPGFWYPMGIFTPDFKAVGVAPPGTPGFGIARTNHIAFGATNGYSDGIDLYIETLDPNNPGYYLEGDISKPLIVREETIWVKDSEAEGGYREQKLTIRNTSRGPLISDHGMALSDNRAISLRWATIEAPLTSSMGTDKLLVAKTVEQAKLAMAETAAPLSQIVVDSRGSIARISSGHVPIRVKGDGARPYVITDSQDNWQGIIPANEMPMNINPARDWVGTANHRIVKADYPYQYSTYFSPSWRYRRIGEFIENREPLSSDDHRELVNDVKNPMAQILQPIIVKALAKEPELANMTTELKNWDFFDKKEAVAPTIFQVFIWQLATLTFEHKLGEQLSEQWLDTSYLWQERLVAMLSQPAHAWFDNPNTPDIETTNQIIVKAMTQTQQYLSDKFGDDMSRWQWGDLHTVTLKSPVIPGEAMARLFGGGVHPFDGSGETLNRGLYKYSQGFDSRFVDSVRFIADMSDPDKITAVIPGGSSGRYFNEHLSDQSQAWLDGGAYPIWFNPQKVKQHITKQLVFKP